MHVRVVHVDTPSKLDTEHKHIQQIVEERCKDMA